MRLDGKVAFVTGAGSGIGQRIAQRYAEAGAAVALADLNRPRRRRQPMRSHAKARVLALGVDVTDEAGVDAAIAATANALGGLDILVSNAGIQIVAPVTEFDFADWKGCSPSI